MTAKKKTSAKKTVVKAPKSKITAQTVKQNGTVLLSDGGRTTCGRTASGFSVKVGDAFKKNKDGSYSKV